MAKYGMSMCVLGMAEELKPDGIAVNALWPRTGVYGMEWYLLCDTENTYIIFQTLLWLWNSTTNTSGLCP